MTPQNGTQENLDSETQFMTSNLVSSMKNCEKNNEGKALEKET